MHYIILVFKIENSMTITFTYLLYGRASTVTYELPHNFIWALFVYDNRMQNVSKIENLKPH